MKRIFFILFLILPFVSNSQDNALAVINDRDGYTNVREEGSKSSKIVGKIEESEMFSFRPSKEDWLEIYKPAYFKPLIGFVHRSRVQPVANLSTSGKKQLIRKIFTKELELIKSENWEEYNNHHEPKFDFILNFAADFIVQTKDMELVAIFIEIIKLNVGTADEQPSWTFGWIYLKEPDWTIEQIKKVGVDNHLKAMLEFGFDNVVYGLEDKTEGYKELKSKIDLLN